MWLFTQPGQKLTWPLSCASLTDVAERQTFCAEDMRPQDPRGNGTGLRIETGEHGGDYPDNMPQAITVTDAQGRWAVYVPLRVNGKIVVPQTAR